MPDSIDHIMRRHGLQMQRIDKRFKAFFRAAQAAEELGVRRDFISDAHVVLKKLGGPPGAGAIEIYEDLPSDIAELSRFLASWSGLPDAAQQSLSRTVVAGASRSSLDLSILVTRQKKVINGCQRAIDAAEQLYKELITFQDMVRATDPEVRSRVNLNLTLSRQPRKQTSYAEPEEEQSHPHSLYTDSARRPCWGLCRATGMIGFGVASYLSFEAGCRYLGVSASGLLLWDLTRKEIVLAVGSVLIGMIASVVGVGVGAKMSIRSNRVSDLIDALWHFGANGALALMPLSGTVLGFAMGREAAMQYARTAPYSELVWLAFILPVLTGWTVGLFLYFAVQILPRLWANLVVIRLAVHVGPAIICASLGIIDASIFGLNPLWGLALIPAPLLFVPLTVQMISKDRERRLAS